MKGNQAVVNGTEYSVSVVDGLSAASAQTRASAAASQDTEVKAAVPGAVLRVSVSEGTSVAEGDELLVMDVMKMETPVNAPCAGTVKAINVAQSDKVNTGDVLVVIG